MILCVCPNPSVDSYAWLMEFKKGMANRMSKLDNFPGGKGIHVACALSELEVPVHLLGIWAGKSGEFIRQECEKRGVHSNGIEIEGENRKCYTFRSENSEFNSTELLEPGPSLSDEKWTEFLKIFEAEAAKAELICISGSFPKNAPEDAYFQLLEACNQLGKKAIIDCSGIQLKNALKTSFFGIHINEHEIKDLEPQHSSEENLEKIAKKCDLVALTLGKKGLKLYENGNLTEANVQIDNVISTVGSGDCLTAGILAALHKKYNTEDMAKMAVACGAANCLNEDLGMLRKDDVSSLFLKAQSKKLIDVG